MHRAPGRDYTYIGSRSNLSSWSQVVNGFNHRVSMHCEAAPLAAIAVPLPPLQIIAPGQQAPAGAQVRGVRRRWQRRPNCACQSKKDF